MPLANCAEEMETRLRALCRSRLFEEFGYRRTEVPVKVLEEPNVQERSSL